MAKAKQQQQRSASQRREQTRQQRRQNDSQNVLKPSQNRKVRRTVRRGINPWWFIGGVFVILAIIVGVFVYLSNQQGTVATSGTTDPTVLKEVTHVNPSLLSQVGMGGVKNPFQATKGSPPPPILTGPTGKPEFLYYGAEFCPYCAGQRWGVVVALSRFGTFTQLPETASTKDDVYPNTATFSFYKSSYSSSYIDFVPIEAEDGQGRPLQTPTPDQQALISKYNALPYTQSPGGFPFIDVANQYLAVGPAFVPDVLAGLSQKDIANQLSSTDSNTSKDIMGTANYLTASICAVTKNQPANVCSDSAIQQIEQSLPRSAMNVGGTQLASAGGQLDMLTPTHTWRRV